MKFNIELTETIIDCLHIVITHHPEENIEQQTSELSKYAPITSDCAAKYCLLIWYRKILSFNVYSAVSIIGVGIKKQGINIYNKILTTS